jgi:uncharacterized membrane protein
VTGVQTCALPILLTYGIGTKSPQTNIAAFYIFILSAIGALMAYFTGEAAEETIEEVIGNIQNEAIRVHEEFAKYGLISLLFLGIFSLFALYVMYKKLPFANSISKLIVALSVVSFVIISRVGYLGGLIRHTEITNAKPIQNQSENETEDEIEYQTENEIGE